MRLLLVDDDAALRELLRATFESFDIEVLEAASGEEAEATVRRELPDVIVLDVLMPGIDGLELCHRVKADPATRDIAVVLLTGADPSVLPEGGNGADAIVAKPFRPLELLALVERLAGGAYGVPFRPPRIDDPEEQLLLYARGLRHVLELERAASASCSRGRTGRPCGRSRLPSSKRTPGRGRTRSACSDTRSCSPRRSTRRPPTTRAPNTAFCSTTSARSGSRTGSC